MNNKPSNGKASKILRHILSNLVVVDLLLGLMMYALRSKTKTKERIYVEDFRAPQFYTSYILVVNCSKLVSSTLHTMQEQINSSEATTS
jgi:hypothetical protein